MFFPAPPYLLWSTRGCTLLFLHFFLHFSSKFESRAGATSKIPDVPLNVANGLHPLVIFGLQVVVLLREEIDMGLQQS